MTIGYTPYSNGKGENLSNFLDNVLNETASQKGAIISDERDPFKGIEVTNAFIDGLLGTAPKEEQKIVESKIPESPKEKPSIDALVNKFNLIIKEGYEVLNQIKEMTTAGMMGVNLAEKKSPKKVNPWAVCTASVGRDDKAKYERCVKKVKKKGNIKESVADILRKVLTNEED